jgi:hypothetical protein
MCNILLKCMKHTVVTCHHLLVAAQRRLIDAELDASMEVAHGPRTSAVRSASPGRRRGVRRSGAWGARRKRRAMQGTRRREA